MNNIALKMTVLLPSIHPRTNQLQSKMCWFSKKHNMKIIIIIINSANVTPNVGHKFRCTCNGKHKWVAAVFLYRVTSSCRKMGLSDHKRSESLQFLSQRVSIGLRMRRNCSKPLSGLSIREHIHTAKEGKEGIASWIPTPGSNEIGMHTQQPLASTQPCEM